MSWTKDYRKDLGIKNEKLQVITSNLSKPVLLKKPQNQINSFDQVNEVFICLGCLAVYDRLDEAEECCNCDAIKVYECNSCKNGYLTTDKARMCCSEDIEESDEKVKVVISDEVNEIKDEGVEGYKCDKCSAYYDTDEMNSDQLNEQLIEAKKEAYGCCDSSITHYFKCHCGNRWKLQHERTSCNHS